GRTYRERLGQPHQTWGRCPLAVALREVRRLRKSSRASSGVGLQNHAAEPVAGEERELHIEAVLAEGTAAKLLRLLDPVLGRVPMDEELVGRGGVAATGLEEYPRGVAQSRM